MSPKIVKTDAEWRAQLSDEQYRVTRKHGTERALQAATMIIISKGLMPVFVAGQNCFTVIRNLIQAQAGLLFTAPALPENVGEKIRSKLFHGAHRSTLCAMRIPFRPCI